jgi:hypothetical protein
VRFAGCGVRVPNRFGPDGCNVGDLLGRCAGLDGAARGACLQQLAGELLARRLVSAADARALHDCALRLSRRERIAP